MAITLIVEDGSGKSNANSYTSIAEGDAYHDAHLYSSDWTGATDATKDIALAMATRQLDEKFTWDGTKANETNALQWPRHNTTDRGGYAIESTEIPQDLINATAELARLLIGSDRTAESGTKGFSELKAGSLMMKIDKSDSAKVMDDTIISMVSPFGSSKESGVIRLVRA
jgi:hypothetical protein